MVKWEYKVVVLDLADVDDSRLNQWGSEGWELCSAERQGTQGRRLELIFKRMKTIEQKVEFNPVDEKVIRDYFSIAPFLQEYHSRIHKLNPESVITIDEAREALAARLDQLEQTQCSSCGRWYLSVYDRDGRPIGSQLCAPPFQVQPHRWIVRSKKKDVEPKS